MILLEGVIINVLVFVVCMYIDRYALDNFCKDHPLLDRAFKVWLIITFLSVGFMLVDASPLFGC